MCTQVSDSDLWVSCLLFNCIFNEKYQAEIGYTFSYLPSIFDTTGQHGVRCPIITRDNDHRPGAPVYMYNCFGFCVVSTHYRGHIRCFSHQSVSSKL